MSVIAHPQKMVVDIGGTHPKKLFVFTGWISFPPGGMSAGSVQDNHDFNVTIPDSLEFVGRFTGKNAVVVATPSSFTIGGGGLVAVDNAVVDNTAGDTDGLHIIGSVAMRDATLFLVSYQVTAFLDVAQ